MNIRIIGVPLDLGSDFKGAGIGPTAMRIAGLQEKLEDLGHSVTDEGDLLIASRQSLDIGSEHAKYLSEIQRIDSVLCDHVERALEHGDFPVVLGGDHAMAVGTISGVARFYRKQEKKIGVIWIDAHADINTAETSLSGNIHGMPLAAIIGMGVPELTHIGGDFQKVNPQNVVLLGIRSVDKAEKALLKKMGVNFFTMTDIDKRGMPDILNHAIDDLARHVDAIHISLDLDGLDPEITPGVATPVKGGLDYREAHLIMETAADCGKLCSIEIAEANPILDIRNRTSETAVELICSALGKRIVD
ncbi:MAG: arginase [Rhizobacter sp.]|nr:arginase [Chlorobiales bacterium]